MLEIQWPDIRYYGYKDWEDYLGETEGEETQFTPSEEMESDKQK